MDMAITDCMPYSSVSNKLSGSKIAFTLGAWCFLDSLNPNKVMFTKRGVLSRRWFCAWKKQTLIKSKQVFDCLEKIKSSQSPDFGECNPEAKAWSVRNPWLSWEELKLWFFPATTSWMIQCLSPSFCLSFLSPYVSLLYLTRHRTCTLRDLRAARIVSLARTIRLRGCDVICTGSFFFVIGLFPPTSPSVYLSGFSFCTNVRSCVVDGSDPNQKWRVVVVVVLV
jgi:hypothetical protein